MINGREKGASGLSRGAFSAWGSALEDTGLGQALLGGVPAVLGVGGVERLELGADFRTVAGGGQDADFLDEGVGVGLEVRGLAVGQVTHVGEAAVGERDEVFVLTEHAESATGALAGAD